MKAYLLFRLDKELTQIETANGIKNRWQEQDLVYVAVQKTLVKQRLVPVVSDLQKAVVERKQYLELITKFVRK